MAESGTTAPNEAEGMGFQAPQTTGEFDHLMDPNFDMTQQTVEGAARQVEQTAPVSAEDQRAHTAAVEAAAVRQPQGEVPPAQTSDRKGYWAQPTQEQVDNAAQHGYDLSQQEKYPNV